MNHALDLFKCVRYSRDESAFHDARGTDELELASLRVHCLVALCALQSKNDMQAKCIAGITVLRKIDP